MSNVWRLCLVGSVYLRGAVDNRPEPWTRLRCSESYWSNPVALPVEQPGVPVSSIKSVTLQSAHSAGEWYLSGMTLLTSTSTLQRTAASQPEMP